MTNYSAVSVASVVLFAWASVALAAVPSPKDQVWAAEVAFAKTVETRDLKAFAEFLSEEAVFFSGTAATHGKANVVGSWKRFFVDKEAPFSWAPDQVEVLASGTLALSTGPVRDPSGKIISRFNSIWRLEAGRWRVVFDKGSPTTPGPN
ncbi:MAG: nuclear transport factor 2 family protein [Steroidobacteraceae bacterium]